MSKKSQSNIKFHFYFSAAALSELWPSRRGDAIESDAGGRITRVISLECVCMCVAGPMIYTGRALFVGEFIQGIIYKTSE